MRGFSPRRMAFIIIVAAAVFSGCSGLGKMKQTAMDVSEAISGNIGRIGSKMPFSDAGLKRVVAFGAIAAPSDLALREAHDVFRRLLVQQLASNCDSIVLLQPNDAGYPENLLEMTGRRSGTLDPLALAQAARKRGVNAVLAGEVIDVRERTEEKGFWLWRNALRYLHVVYKVELYDAETGAKLVDKAHRFKAELEEFGPDAPTLHKEDLLPIVETAADEAAVALGGAVCRSLNETPWTGFVLERKADGLVLSAGKNVGLAPGRELDVFESSTIIESKTGQRFYKPGARIGTVAVATVDENRSTADIVSGDGFSEGDVVRGR